MKVGIITFTEGYNFGNKLKNYALLSYIKKISNNDVYTINNHITQGTFLNKVKVLLVWSIPSKKHIQYWFRLYKFKKFNKNYLKLTKEKLKNSTKKFEHVDIFVCGSDQIWNPNYYSNIDLLTGNLLKPVFSISYAASFGIEQLPENLKDSFKNSLTNLKEISIRENQGKKICDELGLKNSHVNIDPTFLLTKEEWETVIARPKKKIPKKYILTYFLGGLDKKKDKFVNEYCKKMNCERIDLNSTNYLYWFNIDPFEFLYLIFHSELVCTDSFHASVFSIIFNKRFVTFDRKNNENISNKMSSRIDTLFDLFQCTNNRFEHFDGNLESLKLNEKFVVEIIEKEKEKSYLYLSKYL